MSRLSDRRPAPLRRPDAAAVDAPRVAVPRRPTSWIAIGLLVTSFGMVAFMWLSMLLPGGERLSNRPDGLNDILAIAAAMIPAITLPTVGATLAIRRPTNPVGWLLSLGGFGLMFGYFGPEWVERSIVLGSDLPGYRLFDWVYPTVQGLGFVTMLLWLPLLFPDGHLPGPRWRPIAWAAAMATATSVIATLLLEDDNEFGRRLPNPVALDGTVAEVATLVNGFANGLLIGCIALALLSVQVRFRRAIGVERQQLKWFLAAASLVFASMVASLIMPSDWAFFATVAAIGLLPIAIGIAVLRYRLYEIDRLISRTIGWAIVTGLLAGAFVLLVLGLQEILTPLTGGNTLAIAASTIVVAALFSPVRSRVQRVVDRRFDRSRYDGERLLEGLGERLRDEADLAVISAVVLGTVDAAVRPASIGFWLRGRPGAGDRPGP